MSTLATLGQNNNYAFFTGDSGAGSVDPVTFSVRLGGRTYPIDLRQYRRSSQETLREGAVVQSETSDALFNANGAWSRYRYTWHKGADQEVGDLREDADPFRYYNSIGVDPWTEGQLSLLNTVVESKTVNNSDNILCVGNGRVYLSDGADLFYTSDFTTWTTATAPGGTIQSMTTDGTDVYVATSTVMRKYASTAPGTPVTFATAVTGNCTLVSFVANRLLMAKANILYEVGSTGTLTTIRTHYQPSFKWTTAFAIGSRIYFGGYAGTRSELYTASVDSTGALVQSVEAAPLPAEELLNAGYAYSGVALLCTSEGVRLATVGADGTLTYGPLISAFGDTYCAAFDGRFAWVGWTNHPSTGKGLGRLALDVNVEALQPAYASDVFTPATLIFVGGAVTSVARFDGYTAFVTSGGKVYRTSANYETVGYLDSGDLYFGTVEDKILTSIDGVFDPLLANQSVALTVYDEQDTVLKTSTQNLTSSERLTITLSGSRVRHSSIRIVLRGPGTTTPTFRFWRMRAYPVPPAVTQWIVPLIMHTRVVVNGGMGQELTLDPITEMDQIQEWFNNRELVTYQEGERIHRVRVDAYELQPSDWTDDGLFFNNTLIVRLVSA